MQDNITCEILVFVKKNGLLWKNIKKIKKKCNKNVIFEISKTVNRASLK